MIRENYHTHTIYCDGINTPEEMIAKAIELGFNIIGFSGHGHTDRDLTYCMTPENTEKYYNEITRLKEKYNGKITVLCGIEQDIISNDDVSRFDYVIGSCHYMEKDGICYPIDSDIHCFNRINEEIYNGNILEFAKDYYQRAATVCEKTKCDIIGHFDLVSKFFEVLDIKETEEYLSYARNAIDELIKYNVPFEVNTGAISRGYRTSPYPSEDLLRYIKEKDGKIVFSSDCHDKNYLNCYFEEAAELAKRVGFIKRSVLTDKGIEEIEL